VNSNLAPITAKLGKMIRMLASDCDGDVIAAVRAIKRTLRSEGAGHPRARQWHRGAERRRANRS
jgi:hypothetical protein